MNTAQLKEKLQSGALAKYGHLYRNIEAQSARYLRVLEAFEEKFGNSDEVYLLSVPGRSELSGNHTDHNFGKVLAGAIDRDIIAVVAPRADGLVQLQSEGFPMDSVSVADVADKNNFKKYSSGALIAGMLSAFAQRGLAIGGFDAYTETEVLKGSGLSSSAAFEVMVGNILNHLYNGGAVDNKEIAKMAQYAENEYFGNPCGLMDQMACAVGSFVAIDFADPKNPIVEPIDFSLSDAGYALCIVNTGGNHADLNEDYASVPFEMKAVAKALGHEVLRPVSEAALIEKIPALRETVGDRAILRALHFLGENERVEKQKNALLNKDVDAFLQLALASGNSSFKYLQNVYTTKNVSEQGLSLALCLTEGFLKGKGCAWRVHGGGFAGTIQAYVKAELADEYCALMDAVFGKGACMRLAIRGEGAVAITL